MSVITGLRNLYPHLGFDDRPLAASCTMAGWALCTHSWVTRTKRWPQEERSCSNR
jgi:hypothetical protein